ncbi:MAG: homocitrate synthase [Luteibacter sp.]
MSAGEARQKATAALAEAADKVKRLQAIEPFLIDLSLRENPVGARVGQTLADKLAILPRLREFGFKNISLGTLDYAIPDELEVDDDFMLKLRDTGADFTGCFAFTAVGLVDEQGNFIPDPSQLKLRDYGVPNTVHEIYLCPRNMRGMYNYETLRRSIPESVMWLMENIRGEKGAAPRIFINIVDGCDAFADAPEETLSILEMLAGLPLEGVTFEDDRGTYLPCQVGACTAAVRAMLPAPMKVLVHIHAGAGYENASVIEALLNGADGIWGGLPKRAAVIGHASIGELLANLARIGNASVARDYHLHELLPLATGLQVVDEEAPVPEDLPILGSNAYRVSLASFRQVPDQKNDLPAEAIGGVSRYRVCPVVSDTVAVAGRLAEVNGVDASAFAPDVIEMMIRLMRRDLRAGLRTPYDEPDRLLELHARAIEACRAVTESAHEH